MNYQRLQQLDKEKLIKLILEKDKLLNEFEEKFLSMEKLGRLCINKKGYWIWGVRV